MFLPIGLPCRPGAPGWEATFCDSGSATVMRATYTSTHMAHKLIDSCSHRQCACRLPNSAHIGREERTVTRVLMQGSLSLDSYTAPLPPVLSAKITTPSRWSGTSALYPQLILSFPRCSMGTRGA